MANPTMALIFSLHIVYVNYNFIYYSNIFHKKSFIIKQAADSKREEFRKYLEKSGVVDALTKGKYF